MALDPNIALSYRGIEMPDPVAQYGQIAQIQNAQNQNALAKYQLSSAQRSDEQQNALYAAAKQPNFKLDFQSAIQYGAPGIAAYKAQQEAAGLALTQTKTQSEIDEKQLKLRKDRLNFAWNSVGSAATPEIAMQKIKEGLKDGHLDLNTASAELKQVQDLKTPEDFDQYRAKKIMGILNEKDKLSFMLPKISRQDTGGALTAFQDNPMLPGYGQPVAGMAPLVKTQTFADRNAAGNLALQQAKFAFEKANPTMSIQEDPSGMLAVNTRTGVATPVVYGPTGFQAAPTAAPGASMMRQPPAALPGQRIAAIPGMNSVLDQTAAPAPMPLPAEGGVRMPGAPVLGKPKEAPAKFHDIDLQLSGLAGSLKSFKDEIKNEPTTGAPLLPKGADTARMQAKYTALLMGLKDLYTLGALTGPDMSIIESQINNPASWSGKLATYKGIKEQTKVIEDMLERSTQNLENTYGRKPNATLKAMQPLKNVPGGSNSDPLGILGGRP
jgi:hypothetical protein